MKKLVFLMIISCLAFMGCEETADTTPPDISITSPTAGSTVSGTVTVGVLVTDDTEVTSVVFFIDSDTLGVDSEAPFEMEWITTDFSNGPHSLICKAVDEAGNEALSELLVIDVSNVLLTASFTDDWLCAQCGTGVLFYSDMDGNLLWSGTFMGNETIDVIPDEAIGSFPDRIMVTTATITEDGSYIHVTTNLNVKPESWTWKVPPYITSDLVGDVTLNYSNVPDHAGFYVSSKDRASLSRSGTLFSPMVHSLLESPDNLFIRLNTTNDGPQYMMIDDVSVGETPTVDLGSLQSMSAQVINLPTDGEEINFSIRGFFDDNYYSGLYYVDRTYGPFYDQSTNTHTAYYPTDVFSQYRTTLYINEETYPTHNYWASWVIDPEIPSSIEKIDADFEFISTDPADFQIDITGTYNTTASAWEYDAGSLLVGWVLYGDIGEYPLPDLPPEMDIFSESFSNVSFELINASIAYRENVSGQDDVVDIIFRSEDSYYDVVHSHLERRKDPNGLRP